MNRSLQLVLFLMVATSLIVGGGSLVAQDRIQVKVVDRNQTAIDDAKGVFYDFDKGQDISVTDGVVKLPAAKGILVIRKPGFKTQGCVLDGKPNTVVLQLKSEPSRDLKTNPLPYNEALKKKLLTDIKEHTWEKVKAAPKGSRSATFGLKTLAILDPVEVENYLESQALDPETRSDVMSHLAVHYARVDLPAAFEVLEDIDDPVNKSFALCQILSKSKVGDPTSELEDMLIVSSKSILHPAYRFTCLTVLAEHYFHTGRPELCQKIVDQNLEEARQLPAGGWAGLPRSLFAALSVETSPDQSLKILDGMDPGLEQARALGRVAFFCCDKHPANATEIVKTMKMGYQKLPQINYHIAVCARMARRHPVKAVELAKLIDKPLPRSWALGLIAKLAFENDKEFARVTFQDAVELLLTSRSDSRVPTKMATLGGLLPIAEKVAPEMLDELLWETIFVAISTPGRKSSASNAAEIETAAAKIARYDRDLAISLVPKFELSRYHSGLNRSALNQAVLRPEKLSEYFEQFKTIDPFEENTKMEFVAILAGTSEESGFWDAVSKPNYLEWDSVWFEE